MLKLLFAAAASDTRDEIVDAIAKGRRPFLSRESIIVIVSALAIAAAFFVWAAFIRKRPKAARGSVVIDGPGHRSGRYGSSGRRRHRKRRPSHPDNFGRNPTLAEAGGLPPLRSEEPEKPAGQPSSEGQSPPSFTPQI